MEEENNNNHTNNSNLEKEEGNEPKILEQKKEWLNYFNTGSLVKSISNDINNDKDENNQYNTKLFTNYSVNNLKLILLKEITTNKKKLSSKNYKYSIVKKENEIDSLKDINLIEIEDEFMEQKEEEKPEETKFEIIENKNLKEEEKKKSPEKNGTETKKKKEKKIPIKIKKNIYPGKKIPTAQILPKSVLDSLVDLNSADELLSEILNGNYPNTNKNKLSALRNINNNNNLRGGNKKNKNTNKKTNNNFNINNGKGMFIDTGIFKKGYSSRYKWKTIYYNPGLENNDYKLDQITENDISEDTKDRINNIPKRNIKLLNDYKILNSLENKKEPVNKNDIITSFIKQSLFIKQNRKSSPNFNKEIKKNDSNKNNNININNNNSCTKNKDDNNYNIKS